MGKWKDGQVCINCKTTDRPYHAKGLCKKCYKDKWYSDNPEAQSKHHRKTYLKYQNKYIKHASDYYYANKDKVLRRLQRKYREDSFDGNMILALCRDNFECQNNACEQRSLRLDVHHKDGNGIHADVPNHKLENLITLCASCHTRVHAGYDIVSSTLKDVAEPIEVRI